MGLEQQESNPCEASEEPILIAPLDSRRSQQELTVHANANGSQSSLHSASVDIFTHDVLDDPCTQVRLIELMPAPELDDPIHCKLRKVSSLEDEKYTAISYVWGETWGQCNAEVNGKPLPITANLDSVLRRVRARDPTHSQILWIDAICINQGDMNEKNHQISMMRNIYATASKLLVYLGDSDPDIAKLLDGPFTSDMVGIYKLLKLDWWSRAWVFQEFVVASEPPEFGVGNKWISLDRLRQVLIYAQIAEGFRIVEREDTIIPEVTEEVFYDRRNLIMSYGSWKTEKNREVSLQYLLQATASRKATVPHDHIYAVIGLLPLPLPELPVDYCMPISELYQRAMVICIRASNSLSLVERAILQKERTHSVPSWCIDFSTPWYESFSRHHRQDHRRPGHGYLGHSFQQGSLTIMARPLGKVVYVQKFEVETKSTPILLQQYASSIRQFVSKARICLRSRHSDAEIEHLLREGQLWETVLGGRDWDWIRRKYGRPISRSFKFCIHKFSHLSTFKDVENSVNWMYTEPSDGIEDRKPIINLASLVLALKPIWDGTYTMSLTDTGYMVHCKATPHVGDIVCAIPDCVSDVILRPREQQGHILLAPTFVSRKKPWGEEVQEFPVSQLGQFVLY
ncbi:heterokaryon incompatibility protein-domain-containing protein [Xylaria cubensis]|nr:heterokaryon incompatibility protein-domain-containing protein [Xylaria cubensis]